MGVVVRMVSRESKTISTPFARHFFRDYQPMTRQTFILAITSILALGCTDPIPWIPPDWSDEGTSSETSGADDVAPSDLPTVPPTCGNGYPDAGEECDPSVVISDHYCFESPWWTGGNDDYITCTEWCTYDYSQCEPSEPEWDELGCCVCWPDETTPHCLVPADPTTGYEGDAWGASPGLPWVWADCTHLAFGELVCDYSCGE